MPSITVTLSDEEYFEVAKAAKKDKKTPNSMVAEIVRVWTKEPQ